MPILSQHIEYDKTDSVVIEEILKKLKNAYGGKIDVIEISKHFEGKPYLANTLEEGDEEHLIVNTRQFDCLTFVETVASLYICLRNGEHTFKDFCKRLQSLRYRNGVIVDYASRLHYFTWWAYDNEKRGNLLTIKEPYSLFSETQVVNNTYISNNPLRYKHLATSVDFQNKIRCYEDDLNGRSFPYIPKSKLSNPKLLECIKSGDIIGIVTDKKGLDIAHVGFAVWINGNLHLMHASSLKRKVIVDTKKLFDYSYRNNSHLGVRVFRLYE